MVQENSLIVGLVGPTAVGKSELAFVLAERLGTDIISADSMQIYKGFDTGTAKPTADELKRVKHHLIDIAEPQDYFSSQDFVELCDRTIKNLREESKLPLIVGGTGFYFDSLFYELDFDNSVDYDVRDQLNKMLNDNGAEYLYNYLREIDPISAQSIHINNTKRVMRAIEIYLTTGTKKSDGSGKNRAKRYKNTIIFELTRNREQLYERIDGRVDKMLSMGLVNEVEALLKTVDASCQSMQGIGYKELVPYIKGECTLEEASDLIKLNTRHYAKRQLSYFKRLNTIKVSAEENTQKAVETIMSEIEKYNIDNR